MLKSSRPGGPVHSVSDVRMTAEGRRLDESRRRVKHWNRWGPYLAERAWGTVREDYSPRPMPSEYFPHDHTSRINDARTSDGTNTAADLPSAKVYAHSENPQRPSHDKAT